MGLSKLKILINVEITEYNLYIKSNSPMSNGGGAGFPFGCAHTNPICMIDAQHDGECQWKDQTICGEMAVCYVAALEAGVRGASVQEAATIRFRTSIQNITPMCPCNARGDAANDGCGYNEWIQIGKRLLSAIRHVYFHRCLLLRVFGKNFLFIKSLLFI